VTRRRRSLALDRRLDNGMRLVLEESHALPLVDIELTVRAGSVHDPRGRGGLTRLMWRMVRMGTRGQRGHEVEEAIARLGARLVIETSSSYVRLHGAVIRRNLEPFVELLSGLILTPAFRVADLAQVRRETLADLVSRRDNDRALAARAFRTLLFGDHPYARSIVGTAESLGRIDRRDLVAHHRRHVVGSNVVLGFAGAVGPEELLPLVERCFGRLPRGRAPKDQVAAPRARRGRRVLVVDKPDRTQTQIYVGTLGVRLRDPLYYPLAVANTAFGGTFTAPLMQEVREKRGWSYGAYSRLGSDRQRDSWSMWTFPAARDAADCIRLELDLLDRFVEEGVRARDHSFARKYLVNSHCFDVDTAAKRLEPWIDADVFGLPDEFYGHYEKHVRGVTRAASNAAVRKRISRRDVSIALVATASELVPALEALPGIRSVDVIAYDRL
jgi:zinc protease